MYGWFARNKIKIGSDVVMCNFLVSNTKLDCRCSALSEKSPTFIHHFHRFNSLSIQQIIIHLKPLNSFKASKMFHISSTQPSCTRLSHKSLVSTSGKTCKHNQLHHVYFSINVMIEMCENYAILFNIACWEDW